MATLDRLKRFVGGDRLKEYQEQVEPAYGYNPVTITRLKGHGQDFDQKLFYRF